MKVITCFSYKGGAGRTTAAGNIATALASTSLNGNQPPRNVALMDLDVFSAGVHRVFEISNKEIRDHYPCVEDYLRDQMAPRKYVEQGGLTLKDKLLDRFYKEKGVKESCNPTFTLFPSKADPTTKFVVQKQHENILLELLLELESPRYNFDYVVLDGESGTRSMADIALRLADVILIFFRLTWQHIDGSVNTAREWEKSITKPFHLVPTCVPLVGKGGNVYLEDAPGFDRLRDLTELIPEISELNSFTRDHPNGAGLFWQDGAGANRICVHESLLLKGEERVIVFDPEMRKDFAVKDFYAIASKLDGKYGPTAEKNQ
ncbi:MAG: ParA family protein [Acidobacteriaceae bacterium]|nr:ParA family protein [Acidobacteriaceae bacterium]MBV9295914.1 ParA family protein [Acidobacteriaceae bacterium]MBV9765803.1 ParA family protein [Acidobacteriaceae bacterium]